MAYRDSLVGARVAPEKPTTQVESGVVMTSGAKQIPILNVETRVGGRNPRTGERLQQQQQVLGSVVYNYGHFARQNVTLAGGAGR